MTAFSSWADARHSVDHKSSDRVFHSRSWVRAAETSVWKVTPGKTTNLQAAYTEETLVTRIDHRGPKNPRLTVELPEVADRSRLVYSDSSAATRSLLTLQVHLYNRLDMLHDTVTEFCTPWKACSVLSRLLAQDKQAVGLGTKPCSSRLLALSMWTLS